MAGNLKETSREAFWEERLALAAGRKDIYPSRPRGESCSECRLGLPSSVQQTHLLLISIESIGYKISVKM